MHDLDAEILQPLPARRAFECAVGTAGALGIGRPEHHHLGFLHEIFDQAVGFGLPEAHAVAVMVHRAPVPALPAVGIVDHAGIADGVEELVRSADVVADIAPGMVRAVVGDDRALAVLGLDALDLGCDQVERLIPADAHIARNAAVLQVALALGVEIDAFHRMQQPMRRIDRRFRAQRVRRDAGLARRREALAARLDRPGRRVALAEFDRRQAHDLVVLDINEKRPAVGVADETPGAVRHPGAVHPAGALHHRERLREPDDQLLGPLGLEVEILHRLDPLELIDPGSEQARAERGRCDRDRDLRFRMQAAPRQYLPVAEGEMAPDIAVESADLRGEIPFRDPLRIRRMLARLVAKHYQHAEQQGGKFECAQAHVRVPRVSGFLPR